jgi:hypothetical protein
LKSLVDAMPEAYARFAELPAQAYVAILKAAQEVDEPDVQVLDLSADLVDLFHGGLESGCARIAASPHCLNLTVVYAHTTRHSNPLGSLLQLLVSLQRFRFIEEGIAQKSLDLRKKALGLRQCEVTGHF